MRQTFDKSVPVMEQRIRVANMKQPGRKHNHVKGPTRSHEEKSGAKQWAHQQSIKARKFKDAVSAYWRGEREDYPCLKN